MGVGANFFSIAARPRVVDHPAIFSNINGMSRQVAGTVNTAAMTTMAMPVALSRASAFAKYVVPPSSVKATSADRSTPKHHGILRLADARERSSYREEGRKCARTRG